MARPAGARNMVYFGESLTSTMAVASSEALNYLTTIMGVDVLGSDVHPSIGGQTAPRVVPNASGTWTCCLAEGFVAYGGCLTVHPFDWIRPLGDAEAGHLVTDAGGTPLDDPFIGVASIVHPTPNGLDITFPFRWASVYDAVQRDEVNLPAHTRLLHEILGLFSLPVGDPGTGTAPARIVELAASPNPFNPMTTVRFTAPAGSRGSVRVYDLRGRRVRTLHEGEFVAQEFSWNGRDETGASVASGVYLLRGEVDGKVLTKKVALVR